MNEIDVILGTFMSSGAGYLLGKHFERKKAASTFKNFQAQIYKSVNATTTGILDVMRARLPDLDTKVLMQEIVDSCAKYGASVVAYNPKTNHIIAGAKNDNKAQ